MELSLYQIDAFASRPFEGNPAAVCPLDEWLPEEIMQSIAQENNLSETAFFIPTGNGFHIRCSLQKMKWIYAVMQHWHRPMLCFIFLVTKTTRSSLIPDQED